MEPLFTVDGNRLVGHLAHPTGPHERVPAVVIAHGFPAEAGGGPNSVATLPELADRIATECGWSALAFACRGVAGSMGDFSLAGWRRDLAGAVGHLVRAVDADGVWIVGFGTGGALAVEAGAADPAVRGVAAVAAPADFGDWARNPRKLLVTARDVGVVHDESFPASFERWAAEIAEVSALRAASRLAPRALLILHGSEDEIVPPLDARAVADAHGSADLRIIVGAGHHLRHDPRAIAILLGWLERQRSARDRGQPASH